MTATVNDDPDGDDDDDDDDDRPRSMLGRWRNRGRCWVMTDGDDDDDGDTGDSEMDERWALAYDGSDGDADC